MPSGIYQRPPIKVKKICKRCNKEFEITPYNAKKGRGIYCSFCAKGVSNFKGHHHSIKAKEKMSEVRRLKKGDKANNWKGGITPIRKLINHSEKYKQWRQSIFLRDDFTCHGCKQRGGDLEVHHINPFHILLKEVVDYMPLLPLYDGAMIYTPLWDISNGITLCKTCHNKTKKRGYKE